MMHVSEKMGLAMLMDASSDTPLSFDPETWKKILDLVIEYLPKIIALFKLFT
jgi:hypothetical protein